MNAALLASVLVLTALAALRPVLRPVESRSAPAAIATWPETFEGTPLVAEPLLPIEARFAAEFPGATAAFGDGQRRIVMRRITQATRKVHPIETCLRAGGFAVKPAPAWRHPQTGLWGVVRATKDNRTLLVREHIISDDGAHVWTDVSAWYWDALVHPDRGPWLAITVIDVEGSPM